MTVMAIVTHKDRVSIMNGSGGDAGDITAEKILREFGAGKTLYIADDKGLMWMAEKIGERERERERKLK